MMQLEDLSPLIEASDYWADDPSRTLWLRQHSGKISLSNTEPGSVFADLVTTHDLASLPDDVPRLTVFVEWPSGKHQMKTPQQWSPVAPYEGRPYVLGQYDCYTLVRDWMFYERGIEMAFLTDTHERLIDQWLTDGAFVTNEELKRWERVAVPQPGDGILFSMSKGEPDSPNRANHCGVYIGDGTFLHHLPNRSSCYLDYDAAWRARTVGYMRYKG
jgi:hypothetical protein